MALKPRILVVTNFYPPIAYGGYELTCQEANEALQNHGCDTLVLTSDHRREECPPQPSVSRTLSSSFGVPFADMRRRQRFVWLLRHEAHNQRIFRDSMKQFQPDLVYFWNLGSTSRSLFAVCGNYPVISGMFIGDHSPVEQDGDPWFVHVQHPTGNLLKDAVRKTVSGWGSLMGRQSLKGQPRLDFAHYHTNYIRRYCESAGMAARKWVHIPWGIDETVFVPGIPSAHRLLYVGQIAEHKGVHLAIEALALLRNRFGYQDLELTLVGRALDKSYEKRLNDLCRENGLESVVTFHDFVDRRELPEIYRSHSILVFPSIWEEPMGLVPLEAMASGLAVVSSGRGGSGELTRHNIDGLIFENESAQSCADQIRRLIDHPSLFAQIASNARRRIQERFQLTKTLESICTEISFAATSE